MRQHMKLIMMVTVLAIVGLATIAFAGWGRGHGHMTGPGMMGPDWRGGSGYCGYYGNLSADEIAKLEQRRTEFFNATEGIRQQLNEKELALQSELAKDNPDTGKASALQGEISKLRSDLDQKRLDHEIQLRKSVPNYNRGRGHGPMMGCRNHGGGYGRGGGYCMR